MNEADPNTKPMLLLVEDEEDTANLIKLIVEKEGFGVVHATDGRSAADGHTPIMAKTANAMEEDRQHWVDAGMDDFVSKPISSSVVAKVLAQWDGEGHLSRAA